MPEDKGFFDAPGLKAPTGAENFKRYNAEHPDRPLLRITIELADLTKQLTVFNTPLLLHDREVHEQLMVTLSQNVDDLLTACFNKGEKR
jgi:hypothetical protein